jgi:hypothetical protein
MEEFFGDVYYEILGDEAPDSPAMRTYRALLRLYMRTLTQTTAWFDDRPLGVLGRLAAQNPEKRGPLPTYGDHL